MFVTVISGDNWQSRKTTLFLKPVILLAHTPNPDNELRYETVMRNKWWKRQLYGLFGVASLNTTVSSMLIFQVPI